MERIMHGFAKSSLFLFALSLILCSTHANSMRTYFDGEITLDKKNYPFQVNQVGKNPVRYEVKIFSKKKNEYCSFKVRKINSPRATVALKGIIQSEYTSCSAKGTGFSKYFSQVISLDFIYHFTGKETLESIVTFGFMDKDLAAKASFKLIRP